MVHSVGVSMAELATSLEDFVAQAQPISWGDRSKMLTHKWFEWPPDIFALSAMLLGHTGAYRRAVSPVEGEWPESDWARIAARRADEWRKWVAAGSRGELPASIEMYRRQLDRLGAVKIDHLYDPEEKDGRLDAWELCRALLELMSISDQVMRGIGVGFAPKVTLECMEQESTTVPADLSSFVLQASVLLALRGSLSRLPKYRGIVLPKARTPQVGLTLRSFSNNVTFHHTEVDVAWRSFPWFNSDENTINIMIVPWPYEVRADYFAPVPHPKAQSHLGPHRYFHYESRGDFLDPGGLIRAIRAATSEVRRIHVLVFPEMALRERELAALQKALSEELSPQQIPMIVTGTSAKFVDSAPPTGAEGEGSSSDLPEEPDGEEDLAAYKVGIHAAGSNRVVLSLYYGERWYSVVQDKHHRWKLDGRQIEQYQLGAMLTGTRDWWEAIQITRRRLSVLAANTWLTICPLICEDLARLDPVSEVVRGVGPTLLIALLLDGPQLKERWSARYGSVFADDPGSSVLTVTSLGMSERSVRPGIVSVDALAEAKERSRVVALWKDKVNWHEVEVKNGARAPLKILTIGARWETEAAFDDRIDRESSAVFVYQGMSDEDLPGGRNVELDRSRAEGQAPEAIASKDRHETRSRGANEEPRAPDLSGSADKRADAREKKRSIRDMCELTLLTYYVDALVDADNPRAARGLAAWFRAAMGLAPSSSSASPDLSESQKEIISWIEYSRTTRDLVDREIPTPHMVLAVAVVTELVGRTLAEISGEDDRAVREPPEEPGPPTRYHDDCLELWTALKNHCTAAISEVVDEMAHEGKLPRRWSRGRAGTLGSLRRTQAWLEKLGVDPGDLRRAGLLSAVDRGRLMLTAPLSILWAIHVRLTTQRRYGVLSFESASLLEEIGEFVDTRSGHFEFIAWKERMESLESPGTG